MSYNLSPHINGHADSIILNSQQLVDILNQKQKVFFELYPGINRQTIIEIISENFVDHKIIDLESEYLNKDKIKKVINQIGDDRIFAKMQEATIADFYNQQQLTKIISENQHQKIIVVGMGTVLIEDSEATRVHLSLPRWEIQKNYRRGEPNWMQTNNDAENTVKFKFGYFFDWRVADKLKASAVENFDYFIDCTNGNYSGLSNNHFFRGLIQITNRPFRLTPFFDPGVWGGQWMKDKFGLDPSSSNYAWSFDGVPEENSVLYKRGDLEFNYPGIDIVLLAGEQLLGADVVNKYGYEFPIRFDLLDTIGGQNLSLQVHPTAEYIKSQFKMNYTQEESYYILDTGDEQAYVYIGLKNGISKEQFFTALEQAYHMNQDFKVEDYVNKIQCKKGDHFLIPAGTIHCSGSNVMVLEISQTPYIFTFKLWDWNRLDLNGKPRAINLNHGKQVLNQNYDTDFVYKNLYNHFVKVSNEVIKSGLHDSQDIHSYIITTSATKQFELNNKFHMLNVVDGKGVIISSATNQFEDYVVNQYETVIIPAAVGSYQITPLDNQEVKYVQVYNK